MNYDRILKLSYDNKRILESKKKDDKFCYLRNDDGKIRSMCADVLMWKNKLV